LKSYVGKDAAVARKAVTSTSSGSAKRLLVSADMAVFHCVKVMLTTVLNPAMNGCAAAL
jgi:hypothetical protein